MAVFNAELDVIEHTNTLTTWTDFIFYFDRLNLINSAANRY